MVLALSVLGMGLGGLQALAPRALVPPSALELLAIWADL